MVSIGIAKRKLTAREYHLMAETGILQESDRRELIDGEIVEISPIGTNHATCVRRLNQLFNRLPGDRVLVDIQNPIALSDDRAEPQPDLVLLPPRPDYYREQNPTPLDVLLLVEVADSKVDCDRNIKMLLYARSQIQEAWLVDLVENCIEVYRQPTSNGYSLIQKFWRGQQLSPSAFPYFEARVDFVVGL